MNNQIIVPNVYNSSPDEFFDGSAYIPREIGDLKLLRKECRNQTYTILYCRNYDNEIIVIVFRP